MLHPTPKRCAGCPIRSRSPGGTSGIGAGVATFFAALGARVLAAGLGAAEVEEGQGITLHELDVTEHAAVEALVGGLDRLDIVVNGGGIIRRHDEHRPEVFAQVMDVNLNGTMRVCTGARSKLGETHGCIVNMASMLSFFGGGPVPGYAASKGGIAQLTKSLALAYAAEGMRVNAVAPGWIATPLTQALQDDSARARPILERTPLGRWGTPSDVARAVAFRAAQPPAS